MKKLIYTGNRGDRVSVAGETFDSGEPKYLDDESAKKIEEVLNQSQQGSDNPIDIKFETSYEAFSFNNESEDQ